MQEPTRDLAAQTVQVSRFAENGATEFLDAITVEQPLEITLEYGPGHARVRRAVSVTMRTPGHDVELALGFLLTEGVLPQEISPEDLHCSAPEHSTAAWGPDAVLTGGGMVSVSLTSRVAPRLGSLERNFYATSSCGICGKASLLALRSVAPPRRVNDMMVKAATLVALPETLRAAQGTFRRTGGLHAAGLFDSQGVLQLVREDVGRHNAVDKLVGASLLTDELPLRGRILLLSGRISFELMQKAVMAGVACVAAIGAPSSLAVEVAQAFDVTLIGFLRDDHFNIYHGGARIVAG